VTGTNSAPRCVFKTMFIGLGMSSLRLYKVFPITARPLWRTTGGDTGHPGALKDRDGIGHFPRSESLWRFDQRPEMFTYRSLAQNTRCGGLIGAALVEEIRLLRRLSGNDSP
jgi:hypothetical protein